MFRGFKQENQDDLTEINGEAKHPTSPQLTFKQSRENAGFINQGQTLNSACLIVYIYTQGAFLLNLPKS